MRWNQSVDPISERAFVKKDLAQQTQSSTFVDPNLSASISRIQQQYGWMSPETSLILAKSGASQPAIDKAAEMSARRLVDRNDPIDENNNPVKSFWLSKVYPKIKSASRWTQAGLDFIPEMTQGAVAQIFDDNDDVNGFFISTKLGTMFEDSDKAGQGWFVGDEAATKQAERARRYRGTVNGSAWTLGRQAASLAFLPNSKPYNLMSGVIDAAVLIKLDPTGPMTKAIKGVRALKYAVPLQSVDEAAETSRLLRAESGLRDTEALDANQWLRFMNGNRRARALVDRIWFNSSKNKTPLLEADELTRETVLGELLNVRDNAQANLDDVEERFKALDATREELDESVKILNEANDEYKSVVGGFQKSETDTFSSKLEALVDIFTDPKTGKLRVDTDTINDLLNAGSRDEVLAVLSPQWVVKSGSLPEDIRRMQGITGAFADRIPLTGLRKSKLFTQMPGSKVVVRGSDLDNREAVITFRNWVQTLGVDKATQQRLLVKAFQSFSRQGTGAEQFQTVELFFDALGSALKSNGIDPIFADALKADSQMFADALRLYNVDQAGKQFDGGFFDWLRQSGLENDPEKIRSLINKKLDPDMGAVVVSPLTMVEQINRVVYLPNIRELRRLTRSRLMTENINKLSQKFVDTPIPKLTAAVTTKKSRVKIQVLANKVQIDEANVAVKELDATVKQLTDETSGMFVDTPEFADASKRLNDVRAEREGLLERIEEMQTAGYVDDEISVRRGELRTALSAMEWYQQELWKPLALMTGGYVVRNTLDAQIRMALAGFSSVINHPFKYIAIVTGRSAVGDVIGNRLLPRLVLPDGQIPKDGLAGIIQKFKYGNYTHADFAPELAEEMSFGLRQMGLDDAMNQRMMETKQFVGVSLAQNPDAWFRGFGQNGNQLFADDLMRLVARAYTEAAQTGARDLSQLRQVIAFKVTQFIQEPANEKILRTLRSNLENGITIRDDVGGQFVWKSKNWDEFSPEQVEELLTEYSTRMILNRVEMMAGGQDDVMFMFGYNAVPLRRKGVTVLPKELPLTKLEGRKVGEAVQIDEKTWAVVTKIDFKAKVATVQPVHSTQQGVLEAFPKRNVSFVARNRLQEIVDDGNVSFNRGETGLPAELKYEEIIADGSNKTKLGKTMAGFDRATDWFFGRLYASVTTKLDRSPVFRQAYYRAVEKQLGRLTPNEAKRLVEKVKEAATKYDFSPERYVGDRKIWKRIVAKSEEVQGAGPLPIRDIDVTGSGLGMARYDPNTETFIIQFRGSDPYEYRNVSPKFVDQFDASKNKAGYWNDTVKEEKLAYTKLDKIPEKPAVSVTVEDLDDYAKWVALDEVKGLLYNASAKNNLEDSLRIVAPFATAWREILGTYTEFMLTNPVNTYRQFQRVWTGLEGADPENDGRGFIYKDPTSGSQMFKFPMTGVLARALSGTSGYLEAPIKQLSAGVSIIPALGPYGQIVASKLPDNPSYDEIIEVLLPYGRTEKGSFFFNLTPGWVRKATEALAADPKDQSTLFYNTYIDTVRAKAATGEYDLSDTKDKERLLEDSRNAARVLMAMRAASQFFGPTAGTVEFQIPTNQGDQYISVLSQEFYKMQAEDYDSAIPRFLEEFGDDAFVYVAGKTRALREGLEATEEFGDWERQNQGLLAEYRDVAAYFAPQGSDFSFAVWQRQLLGGEREKLSDRDILLLAQERVGSAKYRAMRLKAGPYPSEEVRDYLREYRRALAKQYPGFPEVARFEVGKFPAQMNELEAMIQDSRLGENQIAVAVREYLALRTELINRARAAGYVANDLRQTKALEPYRNYLASIGNELIRKTPEFARIYDRLLSQEVEF